ncbi:MAG TPA: hypothetical protein VFG59_08000, partial [Anaeromyxobacter sp.]|nr:hypothetical protein [Anaeromyxobacter sp.]
MSMQDSNLEASAHSLPHPSVLGSLRSLLVPECLLEGTPYRQMWRERESRLVVMAGRTGLLATAVALVLHHFLVDVPLHKEPTLRWAAYRFGGGAFFCALALLYWVPLVQRTRWVRLPLLVGTIAISALEAKAVEWSPTVSYFYAFVLAVVGVLVLRQSVLGSLASYALCIGVQWAVAWQDGAVGAAEISSATLVGAMLVLLFRGRAGGDIRWFLTEKRELDAQKKLIETQIELDRLKTNFFTNVSH